MQQKLEFPAIRTAPATLGAVVLALLGLMMATSVVIARPSRIELAAALCAVSMDGDPPPSTTTTNTGVISLPQIPSGPRWPGQSSCFCPENGIAPRSGGSSLRGCPNGFTKLGEKLEFTNLSYFTGLRSCTITISGDAGVLHLLPSGEYQAVGTGCAEVRLECEMDGVCTTCDVCTVCVVAAGTCRATVAIVEGPPDHVVTPEQLPNVVMRAMGGPEGGSYFWDMRVFGDVVACDTCVQTDPICRCEHVTPPCPNPPGCLENFAFPGRDTLRLGDHPAFPFNLSLVQPGDCVKVRVRYVFAEPNGQSCEACSTHRFIIASDRDGDGLGDAAETGGPNGAPGGTDPDDADSDDDGYCDGDEVLRALSDPMNAASRPAGVWIADEDGDGLSKLDDVRIPKFATAQTELPEVFDTDHDGVPDLAELRLGLDPRRPRTATGPNGEPGVHDRFSPLYAGQDLDDDLLDDDFERRNGLDPLRADMDGDGIRDGVELRWSPATDPFTTHRLESADTDGDGLSDYEEGAFYGSNPNSVDSDRDGLLDFFEVKAGLNPATGYSFARRYTGWNGQEVIEQGAFDFEGDLDGDGVTNQQEQQLNIDPLAPDTDGDGVLDGVEIGGGSDPGDASDGGEADDVCWFMVTIGGHIPGSRCDTPGNNGPTTIGTDLRPIDGVPFDDTKHPNRWTITIGSGDNGGADGTTRPPFIITTGPDGERTIVYIPLIKGRCYDIDLTFGGYVPGGGGHIAYFAGLAPVNMQEHDPSRGGPPVCGDCCCHTLTNPANTGATFPGGVMGDHCYTPDPTGMVVRMCLPVVDLDIDSDNSEPIPGSFIFTQEDDDLERASVTGQPDEGGMKVVLVNREDRDVDGILDFADGFNGFDDTENDHRIQVVDDPATPQNEAAGPPIPQSFTPMVIDCSKLPPELRDGATVILTYSSTHPQNATRILVPKPSLDERDAPIIVHSYALDTGLMRIWRKGSNAERHVSDFVASGTPYPLSSLLGTSDIAQLYVEAVNGAATPQTIRATIILSAASGCTEGLSSEVRVLPLDPLTGIGAIERIAGFNIARPGATDVITGTPDKDILVGSDNDNDHSETINGGGGDDIILPGGGWDIIDPGTGRDVVYSWRGNKDVRLHPNDDTLSHAAGMLLGAQPLSTPTSDTPSAQVQLSGPRRAERFSSEDIVAAYDWAFGEDDIWYDAFLAGGGKVKAVEGDGWPFSYWDIDWIKDPDPQSAITVGYIVKIQYNIGSVVDAAMALRKAILSHVAVSGRSNLAFGNYILGVWLDNSVDMTTSDRAAAAWEELRARQFGYAKEATSIIAGLYVETLWSLTAGPAGDIVDAIVSIPQTASDAGTAVLRILEVLPLIPGSVYRAVRDPNGGLENFLDCLVPPGGPGCGGGGAVPPPPPPPEMLVPLRQARVLVRALGLAVDEGRDVVRVYVNGPQGDASELGFVLRRDFFPGEPDTIAPVIRFVDRNGRKIPMIGTAQAVRLGDGSLTTHASTINRMAQELAEHGRLLSQPAGTEKHYLYIGMNRSTRTMTGAADDIPGIGVTGDRLTANIDRPDLIAVYWDPISGKSKVEMFEVPSGNQQLPLLVEKMQEAMNTLPQQYRSSPTLANVVNPDP